MVLIVMAVRLPAEQIVALAALVVVAAVLGRVEIIALMDVLVTVQQNVRVAQMDALLPATK